MPLVERDADRLKRAADLATITKACEEAYADASREGYADNPAVIAAVAEQAVTESGMSKAITHKTHFGQIAKIEYQGALVTISMMRWGILKRNFMSSPFTFRPRYETAIFDGPVANPTKCFCTFFYADEATALEEWGPLVQGIEDQGLMATLTDRRFLLSPAKVGLFINRTRQFAPVGVDAPLVMSS